MSIRTSLLLIPVLASLSTVANADSKSPNADCPIVVASDNGAVSTLPVNTATGWERCTPEGADNPVFKPNGGSDNGSSN